MSPVDNLEAAWERLAALGKMAQHRDCRSLFADDQNRAANFSAHTDDLTLDFSKSSIDAEALEALLNIAKLADVTRFRDRMFAGEMVNSTEQRAALHAALRAPENAGLRVTTSTGIEDASAFVDGERRRMRDFVEAVHSGRLVGATGLPFDTVLNIGIGGSDLGPSMAAEALTLVSGGRMRTRFLSNVDGHAFAALARELDPARTLVLVASKTFTTIETATNANAVRNWLAAALGDAAIQTHFVALSTNKAATAAFGIAPDRVFGFRDWVGGRYSVWSPIGLSVALAAGWPAFQSMLDGAYAMDQHFRTAPLAQNLPVLLALVGIWHVNAMGYGTQCRTVASVPRLSPAVGDGEQRQGNRAERAESAARHLSDYLRRARNRCAAQFHPTRAPGDTDCPGGLHLGGNAGSRSTRCPPHSGRERAGTSRGIAERERFGRCAAGDAPSRHAFSHY